MTRNNDLYIGLMSGTSLDAVDAALVQFADNLSGADFNVLATLELALPDHLRSNLLTLINQPHAVDLDHYGQLHRQLGELYAAAVVKLLQQEMLKAEDITAIGCHGQTVRHRPDLTPAFTLQIGDAATVAAISNITVIADFRSADIAVGGQGAPLVPAFHQWAFGQHAGCVVNIGGIANLTVTGANEPVGFDTGPGNVLLDAWCERHTGKKFDRDGAWAANGIANMALLETLLTDPYFQLAPPKSTGRELFNLPWLNKQLAKFESLPPQDVQATLSELTAASIATAVQQQARKDNVWLCGGGARNTDLLNRIATRLPASAVTTTAALGIEPEWVEAAAFAWLARARMHGAAAGMPSVTGARQRAVMGAIHMPPEA